MNPDLCFGENPTTTTTTTTTVIQSDEQNDQPSPEPSLIIELKQSEKDKSEK